MRGYGRKPVLGTVMLLMLACVLALGLVPASAFAETAEEAMGEEPAVASVGEPLSLESPSVEEDGLGEGAPLSGDELASEDGQTAVVFIDDSEQSESRELTTQSASVSNPRIVANSNMEAGQKVTYDCVWLGSYPQTEVAETAALKNANWTNGDATVGGTRYRRISKSDATKSDYWPSGAGSYRYFRYEPIKWRILKVNGSTALVVADVALDCRQYHKSFTDVAWETSTIRSWLNATGSAPYYFKGAQSGRTAQGFAAVAFSGDQLGAVRQSSVVNAKNTGYGTSGGNDTNDRVFLLSESEIYETDYGFVMYSFFDDEARNCKVTDYSVAMGVYTQDGDCDWWLRSPGSNASYAVIVISTESGKGWAIQGGVGVNGENVAVRPALNLDLSSSEVAFAGTVSSDGTMNEVAAPTTTTTPTPTPSPSPTPTRTFPDVAVGTWYHDVVGRAAGLGLINGYGNGNFGPNDKVKRGQVAAILWNMAGKPAAGKGARSFPDVASNKYYYAAIRWASSVGVVNGYGSGKFGPDDLVTREQLAVMLANYSSKVAGRPATGSASDYASMSDAAKVSSWAAPSVGWCFRNGIISGKGGGRVDPQGNATRAEAAKMVVYLHDMLA